MIVYGATAGVSPVKLYAAAFLPGFLLTGFYITYVITRAILNPALAPKLPKEQTDIPFTQVLWALVTSFFPLAILIVVGAGCHSLRPGDTDGSCCDRGARRHRSGGGLQAR